MKEETYKALLKDLQKLQKTLVASQIDAVRHDPATTARMARLHSEAEVGGRVDDFVATAARKSTVLFLMRTVFVRVLEDLGILRVKRIRDDWGFAAFREAAPTLGFRAYFAFIFRDLAVDFPALFSPAEDELPLPNEDGCRALWNLWHHPNRDGELYLWNGDGFESRFLGDLYQDLDADIRKRYALLQTPRFVEEYILDHTLTQALAEFDPATLRDAGKTFRVLDPTCGGGHFLIGSFHRLADYWRHRHGLAEWEACERALESVWGCDINPHAVDIANFRLLLEVIARTSATDLERIAALRINVRVMDSLIPWERAVQQVELYDARDRLDAYATPKQRRENAAFLASGFQAVVGNPPYITPKDVRKREDYRAFWPRSCRMKYQLGAPFLERFFSLAVRDGSVGMITASAILSREFGRDVIENVLADLDIQWIIDASLAPIPGHGWRGGVATFMLFGRACPPTRADVFVVSAKRRETGQITNPSQSTAWLSIARTSEAPHDDPFVRAAPMAREKVFSFPLTFGSAEGDAMLAMLEDGSFARLRTYVVSAGEDVITQATDLLHQTRDFARRCSIPDDELRHLYGGDGVRDYSALADLVIPYPYDEHREVRPLSSMPSQLRLLWPYRTRLRNRWVSGGTRLSDTKKPYHVYPQFAAHKHVDSLFIVYAFVTSHPHYALVECEALFEQSAVILKLSSSASRVDAYNLIGLLASSTLAFWHTRRFRGTGKVREAWEGFLQIDGTKLLNAPISDRDRTARTSLTAALCEAAQLREACHPTSVLRDAWVDLSDLRERLTRARSEDRAAQARMVALQEELDWLTYGSYGLISPVDTVPPDVVEPLTPGHRPFEIVFARKDDEAEKDEKSAWWSRHGHDRITEIPDSYSEAQRTRLRERIDLIESDVRLGLLETPAYKRRWQPIDWEAETKTAAESWLLDRLEDLFAPATGTTPHGALAEPNPYRIEDIAVALARVPRVAAVAGIWTGTGPSVDLTLVAEKLLRANALPDNPHRLYSEEGFRKLAEWKRTWALQDQEDAGEKPPDGAIVGAQPASTMRLVDPDDPATEVDVIPVPPNFDKHDFIKPESFSTRGKRNVPRERFIVFADLSPNRFGWAGWRDRERALAQVRAFTLAESDPQSPMPVPTSDQPLRCGVTFGLWESLPDVRRWGASEEHAELQSLAREACRQTRCPCPIVDAWKSMVLNVKVVDEGTSKTKGKSKLKDEASDDAVSLAQRAWVSSLFQPGKELDAAGIWAQHQIRVGGPSQASLPGVSGLPEQLTMHLRSSVANEHDSLDQAQLARVLDDLIASGDLQVAGRGKKKRFQLVIRRGPT